MMAAAPKRAPYNVVETMHGAARTLAESGITDLQIRQQEEQWIAWYEYHEGRAYNAYRTTYQPSLEALFRAILIGERVPLEGEITPCLDIEASDLFQAEEGEEEIGSVNWNYCREHATFRHMAADACEFIIHIGEDYKDKVKEMTVYGCTEEFIRAYIQAQRAGAVRVLFYTT